MPRKWTDEQRREVAERNRVRHANRTTEEKAALRGKIAQTVRAKNGRLKRGRVAASMILGTGSVDDALDELDHE